MRVRLVFIICLSVARAPCPLQVRLAAWPSWGAQMPSPPGTAQGTHSTEPGTWAYTSPGKDGLRGRKRQRGARHRGGLRPAGRGWPSPSPTLNPKGQPGQEKGCTPLPQSRVPGTPGTETLLTQLPESREASLWGVPLARTPHDTEAGFPTTSGDFLVASVPTCPCPSPALEGPRALAGKSACKGLRTGATDQGLR